MGGIFSARRGRELIYSDPDFSRVLIRFFIGIVPTFLFVKSKQLDKRFKNKKAKWYRNQTGNSSVDQLIVPREVRNKEIS